MYTVDRHLGKAMKALMGGVQAEEGEVDEDNLDEIVSPPALLVIPFLTAALGRESTWGARAAIHREEA